MTIFAICPAKIALVSSGQKCYTICPFVDRRRKPLRRRMFAEKTAPAKEGGRFSFPGEPLHLFFPLSAARIPIQRGFLPAGRGCEPPMNGERCILSKMRR